MVRESYHFVQTADVVVLQQFHDLLLPRQELLDVVVFLASRSDVDDLGGHLYSPVAPSGMSNTRIRAAAQDLVDLQLVFSLERRNIELCLWTKLFRLVLVFRNV